MDIKGRTGVSIPNYDTKLIHNHSHNLTITTMKFSSILALVAPLSSFASPLIPRQSEQPVGYASLNGGTTGGAGGKSVTVSTYADLVAAVKGDTAAIVYVKGKITGTDKIRVGSNKSVLGLDSSSGLNGVGLFVRQAKNVIIRNLAISKVATGDAADAVGVAAGRLPGGGEHRR